MPTFDFFHPALGAQLASGLLALGWWLALQWLRRLTWGFAVVALAGTALHELMHFLVGVLLRARPVSFSLIPKRNETGWTLGSVAFEALGLWNAAPVALAPLLLMPLAVLGVGRGLPALLTAEQWLPWLCAGYVAAAGLQASLPSATDWKLGGVSVLLYLGIGGLLYGTGMSVLSWGST